MCVLTITACAQAHTCTSVVHVTVDHSIYACTCTQGIVSVDKEKMEVTVCTGSTLSELNSLLEEHGLAMKIYNLYIWNFLNILMWSLQC